MKNAIRVVFAVLALTVNSVFAQETTGTLIGTTLDSLGNYLSFAKIFVNNEETGLTYVALSDASGYFVIPQLPPDQRYTVRVSLLGFHEEAIPNVVINLGKTTELSVTLKELSTLLDEVVIVSGSKDLLKKSESIGNETTISEAFIGNLPTQNRSLQDVTNVMSESNLNSFGGASFRFNNLSIDGSASNDVLGFQEPSSGASGAVASGTPGGLAGTQPIGFGAIKDVSVKQTPYDVSIGNFTGASINVVTKNGTNQFKTDVYGFLKNRFLLGRYAAGDIQEQSDFSDIQSGISMGGPIVKDKLFYFTNIEFAHRTQNLLNAPGSNTSQIPLEVVQRISDTLRSRYNYDPGSFQNATVERQSVKVFVRFDYSINLNHKLTVRANLVHGFADNLEWTNNSFNFGNQGYRHSSVNYSVVAELKSKLSSKLFNKLTVSNTHVNDGRTFTGDVFPHLEISYNTTNRIFAGTYREAAIYGATLNTAQFTDNLSYYAGKHAFTLGGSLEVNAIEYRFLTAFNGRWEYKSEDDFFNDNPARIRGVYNTENNDFDFNQKTPSAKFNVLLGGIYLQDEWRVTDKLNVLFGVRTDLQYTPNTFPLSNELAATPAFAAFSNTINSKPQVNPRLGFSYAVKRDKTTVIRGGSGLFTGRIPFLWYAYANYISGTRYFNIDIRPTTTTPIISDLSELTSVQPNLSEINLVDNNFSLPKDWKSSIAVDQKVGKNLSFSLEATYSKVLQGLLFQSINRKDSIGQFDGADNRPYFLATGQSIKLNENFTDVFLLTNTQKGYRYTITVSATNTSPKYDGHVAYTYGVSKDVHSAVRNSHAANFEWNQAIVANDPQLSHSNFDLRHKVVSYHFYKVALKKSVIKFGLISNSRSGSPFTFVYAGDVNRDGSSRNDLIYVPQQQSEINLVPILDENNNVVVSADQQWAQLNDYLEKNPYLDGKRGTYVERNGARTPWNHSIDVNIAYEKYLGKKKHKLTISLDVFNIANLFSKNWGKQHFVPNVENSSFSLLEFKGIVNQQPTYQFKSPSGTPWQIDPLASRWQAQLGLKYAF